VPKNWHRESSTRGGLCLLARDLKSTPAPTIRASGDRHATDSPLAREIARVGFVRSNFGPGRSSDGPASTDSRSKPHQSERWVRLVGRRAGSSDVGLRGKSPVEAFSRLILSTCATGSVRPTPCGWIFGCRGMGAEYRTHGTRARVVTRPPHPNPPPRSGEGTRIGFVWRGVNVQRDWVRLAMGHATRGAFRVRQIRRFRLARPGMIRLDCQRAIDIIV
jgi:hypothetical protein